MALFIGVKMLTSDSVSSLLSFIDEVRGSVFYVSDSSSSRELYIKANRFFSAIQSNILEIKDKDKVFEKSLDRVEYLSLDSFDIEECWIEFIKNVVSSLRLKFNTSPEVIYLFRKCVEIECNKTINLLDKKLNSNYMNKKNDFGVAICCLFYIYLGGSND